MSLIWGLNAGTGMGQTSEESEVGTLVGQHRFEEALAKLDETLKTSPDDENALLWKARILSWRGRMAASVVTYKKLIHDHPDKVLYYRECARVLGWSGRVGEASALYDEACQRFPDDRALQDEARAKKAYYNNLYYPAEKGYRQWLTDEPGNPEALFDLGQIHANSSQYNLAEEDYDRILVGAPDDPQAITVRDKAQAYANDWLVEGGFLHDEASSKARQVSYRFYDAYERVEKSFLGNMNFSITTDQTDYNFPGHVDVQRYRYMGWLEQDFLPDTFWKIGYGLSNSSRDSKDLQYRDAEVQFPLLTERLLLNLSYKRDDFIQNESMLNEHLQQDQYRGRLTWTPIRPLTFGADETHSEFTDHNKLDNFGGDAAWTFLYDPTRLTLMYRWQDWKFDRTMPQYFSPSDFPSQRVSLEWEQTLNRNNLYWGANKFTYFVRYEFIDDKGNQLGNSGAVGFKWYVNKRLTIKVQAQHISYNHPGIYTDDEQTITFTFAF
jgi:tetratricopeptide (TPR) repeat protein